MLLIVEITFTLFIFRNRIKMITKLKTRKSVFKRIIVKKSYLARKKAFKGHLLRRKTTKQLRHLSSPAKIHQSDKKRISLMLPYC